MTSILKMVGVVMVVGVLCVAGAALATDFIWDGDGLLPHEGAPALWTEPFHWVQGSSYPLNTNDNATVTDPYPSSTCTYNPSPGVSINKLTVGGVSPTKMKLHVRDASLTVQALDLDNYAELDLDQNLTATTGTTLSGTVWLDVASLTTTDLENVAVDGATTTLAATTSGTLKANDVVIDADAAGASRALKFRGGTWDIENQLSLKSSQTANTYIAKFWLDTGLVAPAFLRLDAGDHWTRGIELDIDQNLTVGTDSESLGGYTRISIAPAKTLNTKKLVLDATSDIFFSARGEISVGLAPQGKLVTAE
ncbi:MAG: hypothetical protein IH988_01100 [Planctomycetes bacterium]|nr:hypothetical protein [Planctomycetota bacterium]